MPTHLLNLAPVKALLCFGKARLSRTRLLCRGCLHSIGNHSEAGLCGACWSGLQPLEDVRCSRCALVHATELDCRGPVGWTHGDAFWDYHGGRPALGAMLVPGIKAGEQGWRAAILRRSAQVSLPPYAEDVDLVTSVPAALHRKWIRGFDLAEDAAHQVAERLNKPFRHTLRKKPWQVRQAGRTATERRRLPRNAVSVRPRADIEGRIILLVDDVWTTGTTLLRCAQALHAGGAKDVRVLTLFRVPG